MFRWLSGRSKIDVALDAEDYPKAMELLEAEIASARKPEKARPLRQTLAEVCGLVGQKERAAQILRELMNEYADDGMHTKAISLHKLLLDVASAKADEDLDELTRAVRQGPKPIELSALEDKEELLRPERVAKTVARTPLFSDLNEEEVRAFIEGLKLHTRQPGDLVMVEGEPGDSLFILTDGIVRVHVRNKAGKSQPIRELEAGTFFGEISIVYGKARTATITCASRCEVLELDRATLDEMSKRHPGIPKVLREFCDRRSESIEELQGRKGTA